MGQSVGQVDAMSLHQFAALAEGWRALHATDDGVARMSDADADQLFAWITSPAYQDN